MFQIVITAPIEYARVLGYEFETVPEAEAIALVAREAALYGDLEGIGIPQGTLLETTVKPIHYDA